MQTYVKCFRALAPADAKDAATKEDGHDEASQKEDLALENHMREVLVPRDALST